MGTRGIEMERASAGPSFKPQVITLLLVMLLFVAAPSYAEEARVFTDEDLAGHQQETVTVDEETMQRKVEDKKEWEARRPETYADEDRKPGIGKKAGKKRSRVTQARASGGSRPAKMAKPASSGKMAAMSGSAKAADMAASGRLAGASGRRRK